MRKFLLIIFLSLFWFNTSHGDTPFDGVQINCYENSGYFEMRNISTSNLNKFGSWEDENLISLHIPGSKRIKKAMEVLHKECKFSCHTEQLKMKSK